MTKLEEDILLAFVLGMTRTQLYLNPKPILTACQQLQFDAYVKRCLQGEPIAYITGSREFWSLDFMVTPDTLIPRPETELLVELILGLFPSDEPKIVADLGTGSGAIALALATEKPSWIIHATDLMPAALAVAKHNAKRFNLTNVFFHEGSWCDALPEVEFDAIISNPPYILKGDPALEQSVMEFEPSSALFSTSDGLGDAYTIIAGSEKRLKSGGYLLLEHGHLQASALKDRLTKAGYVSVTAHRDLAGLDRAIVAQKASNCSIM